MQSFRRILLCMDIVAVLEHSFYLRTILRRYWIMAIMASTIAYTIIVPVMVSPGLIKQD
jgi:hypothetical protein